MKRITAATAKVRGHLNYANVTATVALIFAMGGTAYAAATIGSDEIIDESIQSVDIKNGQVRSDDIGGHQVTNSRITPGAVDASRLAANAVDNAKLASGAVTSDKVQNGSLTGNDINGPSLYGVRMSGVDHLDGESLNNSNSPKSAAATCPAGKRVVGTGYNLVGGKTGTSPNATTDVVMTSAYVSGNSVYVNAYEEQSTTADWKVVAIAICASAE